MTHQPNRNNFPYPIPVEYQNAHNSPNPHLKDEQRMLNESLRSGYPQNINYPSQRPIQFKKTVNDASNSSKNYLSMESSDFKSFTSNIKPIQQHHQIPSIKPNQINQTIHVPKSTYQNINSSYTNKPINYSMNQHKQDANKSKSQSIHGLTNQTVSNLSSLQIHTKPSASVQFHPSYFLLSKFPQLTPKDQIYMPIINRLQNNETKYCFHQLYINLKFLLVQSNEQFWKYLSHLHLISMNGLSDEQIREGYKLRLSLQSCLSNFSIKEFNKCVNLDEVKSSSVAISKRIYKYENIFNSSSFQLYDKLFHTVIEFFQRIVKTRNPYEINIITSSWYLDTLKIMQLATIYGSKQPSRVKQLIKNMLNLEPKLYTRDFVNFIRKLHQYIDSSVYNDNSQQAFSLLQQLNKKLQAVPNKYKHKSNFHNPQKYFGREIFFICSDCLKLFIYVTNIFKFFPSRLKLIFMENTDFLRVLIKISIRVIYNLRVQHAQKKRWKLSAKIKSLMKNLQFILLQKITQMYKFIFLNTKNALQQQIFENDNEDQKTKEQIRQEKIVLKFYKKLIEGTVNRKKDPQKDSFLTHFLNQQSENISESNFSQTNQELVTEKEQNEKSQSESNENESIDLMQQKSQKQNSKDVKLKSEKMNTNNTTKTKNKQQKKIKKEKIPENEYGRVLIKHLLRKQLKKDSNKYRENGYFYTNKLYNYFRQKVRSQKTTKRKSSQLNVSNQQEQQKSIQSIQRGFFKYLLVLEQFQNEVKQQYRTQQQINERFRRVELIMRQLPSLGEFRKREQRMEYDQLMRRLNQGNVQYEDQPTEEQQLEMEWNQRVLDEDDFTRIDEGMLGNQSVIHFNISTQHKQQQQKEQKVSNNNNNHSKSIINFNNNINNNNNNNQSFTSLFNANLSQSQISNQWTFIGKQWTFIGKITNKNKNNNNNNKNNNNNNINNMRYNNNKVRYFEGESSEQLSPQQITDQQLLAQQILSKQSIIANDHSNNNNSNVSNILGNNNTIFKPHEQLKTLSYSMIKQQLQYFNKVKNLNWHQISRISTNNRKNKTNKTKQNNISDTSQDQVLMRFNQMIKVQDIGLSFDMILGDSDEQQVQQNGVSNFSYFYYNQWKHQSTRHKKKSFMDDYSWTHINQTQSNNNQTKSGNNNRSGKQQRQLQQQQSNKFKKTKKMKGQYQQQEQHQQHQHQQKQQNSNINSKKEKYKQSKINQRQQYVRRDYANYMSNSYYNNSSSNKYPHYHPVAGNRINQQQYPQQYKGSHNQFNPMNPINPINPMNSSNPINPIDPMNPLNNSNSYSRMYNQPYSPHTPPNNFINHPPSNYNNPQYRMNNK